MCQLWLIGAALEENDAYNDEDRYACYKKPAWNIISKACIFMLSESCFDHFLRFFWKFMLSAVQSLLFRFTINFFMTHGIMAAWTSVKEIPYRTYVTAVWASYGSKKFSAFRAEFCVGSNFRAAPFAKILSHLFLFSHYSVPRLSIV
mgnify:CR=1 FL=1